MLLTRLPLSIATSFDLHVLGVPPAYVLSHDQTLKLCKFGLYLIQWIYRTTVKSGTTKLIVVSLLKDTHSTLTFVKKNYELLPAYLFNYLIYMSKSYNPAYINLNYNWRIALKIKKKIFFFMVWQGFFMLVYPNILFVRKVSLSRSLYKFLDWWLRSLKC